MCNNIETKIIKSMDWVVICIYTRSGTYVFGVSVYIHYLNQQDQAFIVFSQRTHMRTCA